MQRSFLTNLAFLIIVNLLVKPFWIFGIDRTVQNVVGAADYGVYFAIFNFSFLFHMILDFGITNFNNRAIARNEKLLPEFFPNIMITKLGLALCYGFVTLSIAFFLQFGTFQIHLLAFLLANQVLLSFILYIRSNISALHLFRIDAVLSVLDRLLMIIIIGSLLWGGLVNEPFHIEWLVYGQTGAYAITFMVALVVLLAKKGWIKIRFRKSTVKRILKMSFPFALLGVLMSIYNRIDAVMIERMLGEKGASEAGIYAASFRILDAFNMIGFAFAAILLPVFSRMLKQKKNVERLTLTGFRAIMIVAVTLVVSSFVFRHEIMQALYDEATPYWATIFGWLMISFTGVATVYIYGTLLTANGNIRQLNIIAAGGVLLNIGLNFILISRYDALGATFATVTTQLLVALIHILVARKSLLVGIPLLVLGQLLLLIVLAVGLACLTFYSSLPWVVSYLIVLLLTPAFAFLIRMIRLSDWKREIVEN